MEQAARSLAAPDAVTLPRKITCVISSLGNGGAERVMMELCLAFARRGATVTLITLDDGRDDFHVVPSGVVRVALGVLGHSATPLRALGATATRIRALRKAIRASRPDVVLSFMDRTNVLVLLALRGTGIPVVAAERNNPWMLPIGRGWERLRRVSYRWARTITVQSAELVDFFAGQPPARVVVIPNSVSPVAATDGTRKFLVLAAGRLETQKGFDTLIRAFAAFHAHAPQWHLRIVGEGSERPKLEALRASLGLDASQVALPGRVVDMASEYAAAGLFVLSSRFEGFPNVLCEAMSHGCPVIATRCCSGPAEIVRDGVDGVLVAVDDVAALSGAMTALAGDATRCNALAAEARRLPERFPASVILDRWAQVLSAAALRSN